MLLECVQHNRDPTTEETRQSRIRKPLKIMMMEYISCFDLIVLEIESKSLHSFMILKMNIVKDEKCGAEIFDDGKVCLRNDFDDGKV